MTGLRQTNAAVVLIKQTALQRSEVEYRAAAFWSNRWKNLEIYTKPLSHLKKEIKNENYSGN
jgi:hypothetical protein